MIIVVAMIVAIYAFKVFGDLDWPWPLSLAICLAIVGVMFLPGMGGLLGIILLCGSALMLGMIQKSIW